MEDMTEDGKLRRIHKHETVPEGAIMLMDEDVISHHIRRISTWRPRWEVWPFTWGYGVLLGATSVSGFLINQKYRQLFKLGNTGRITSFLPIVAVPPFLALIFHQRLVTKKILIGEFPCHICATVKSGTIQAVSGCLYPLFSATIYSAVLAKNYTTYAMPSLSEPRRFLESIIKISSPFRGPILFMIIAQYLLGTTIVLAQLHTFENVLLRDPPEEQSYPEEKYN